MGMGMPHGMPGAGMGAPPQGRGMPNLFANILNGGLGGFGGPQPMGHPMGMMPGQPPMPAAAPSYGQPVPQYSYAPPPQQMFAEPRPVQPGMFMPPAAPAVERILVTISGREGVNDVINGAFQSIGEHGGRYSFSKPTNEGPIYLYYDQASDNWCIGDQIGSQSYYAVCGPSNGQDMAQQWRVWTGDEWEVDMRMTATIH